MEELDYYRIDKKLYGIVIEIISLSDTFAEKTV